MADTCRLDAYLVAHGYAGGREKAKELLLTGAVTVNGKAALKPSFPVRDGDDVVCAAPKPRYVGRGGYKLEKALSYGDIDVSDCVCMDIGASTGGFTDCLLQNGAKRVFAVDVGHGQLHPSLLTDTRVTSLENTDIRSDALRDVIPVASVDFACVDVSFVSLRVVLPYILPYLRDNARLVCLIKPQFEAGRSAIGKNGIVKDVTVHKSILREMTAFFAAEVGAVEWITWSPITGGEGNIEYLASIRCHTDNVPTLIGTDEIVQQARDFFKKAKR